MRISTLVTGVLLAAGSATAFASDAPAQQKGVAEMVSTCAACHGERGVTADPQYPNLAGQYANFLERAMLDYQTGKRKNPIMSGQVASLSKQEIKAIAKYFSKQAGPLYIPSAD